MGGMKRAIDTTKMIEHKSARSVTYTKRSKGLYSKASELCLLANAQIAIIATPSCSSSHASFYTFGHSSVDGVVAAFLANQRPHEDLGLGHWWEDESLAESDNPVELRDAIGSMTTMLNNLKKQRLDAVQNQQFHDDLKKQTLNFQSCSASLCTDQYGLPKNFEGFHKNTEEQIPMIYSDNHGLLEMMDNVSMVTMNQNTFSESEAIKYGAMAAVHRDLDENQILAISDNNTNSNNNALLGNVSGCNQEKESESLSVNDVSTAKTTYTNPSSDSEVVIDRYLYEDNIHLSDLDEDQILAISDSNNNHIFPGNMDEFSQELDLDQIIDFGTSVSDGVEDGALVFNKGVDEDNLHFADFLNELNSIVEL